MPSGDELALPHLISGDFDSIKPDILNHFKSLNVSVIHTPDQDETDLTKGMLRLRIGTCVSFLLDRVLFVFVHIHLLHRL